MYKKFICHAILYLSLFVVIVHTSKQLAAFEKFIKDSRPILRNRRTMHKEDAYDIERRMLDAAFKNALNEDDLKLEIEMEQNLRSAQKFEELNGKRDTANQSARVNLTKVEKDEPKLLNEKEKENESIELQKPQNDADESKEQNEAYAVEEDKDKDQSDVATTGGVSEGDGSVADSNESNPKSSLQDAIKPESPENQQPNPALHDKHDELKATSSSLKSQANNEQDINKNAQLKNNEHEKIAFDTELAEQGEFVVERQKLNNLFKEGLRHEAIMAYINGEQNESKDKISNSQTEAKSVTRSIKPIDEEAQFLESDFQKKINSYKDRDELAQEQLVFERIHDYEEPQFITDIKKNSTSSWEGWLLNHPNIYLAATGQGLNSEVRGSENSMGISFPMYPSNISSSYANSPQSSSFWDNFLGTGSGPSMNFLKSTVSSYRPSSTTDYSDNQSSSGSSENLMKPLKSTVLSDYWQHQVNAQDSASSAPSANWCPSHSTNIPPSQTSSPEFWKDFVDPSSSTGDSSGGGGGNDASNSLTYSTDNSKQSTCSSDTNNNSPMYSNSYSKQQPTALWLEPTGSKKPPPPTTSSNENQYPNDLSHEADYKLSSFEQNNAVKAKPTGSYPNLDFLSKPNSVNVNTPKTTQFDDMFNENNWKVHYNGGAAEHAAPKPNNTNWLPSTKHVVNNDFKNDEEHVSKTQNKADESLRGDNLALKQSNTPQSFKAKRAKISRKRKREDPWQKTWPMKNPYNYEHNWRHNYNQKTYPNTFESYPELSLKDDRPALNTAHHGKEKLELIKRSNQMELLHHDLDHDVHKKNDATVKRSNIFRSNQGDSGGKINKRSKLNIVGRPKKKKNTL